MMVHTSIGSWFIVVAGINGHAVLGTCEEAGSRQCLLFLHTMVYCKHIGAMGSVWCTVHITVQYVQLFLFIHLFLLNIWGITSSTVHMYLLQYGCS